MSYDKCECKYSADKLEKFTFQTYKTISITFAKRACSTYGQHRVLCSLNRLTDSTHRDWFNGCSRMRWKGNFRVPLIYKWSEAVTATASSTIGFEVIKRFQYTVAVAEVNQWIFFWTLNVSTLKPVKKRQSNFLCEWKLNCGEEKFAQTHSEETRFSQRNYYSWSFGIGQSTVSETKYIKYLWSFHIVETNLVREEKKLYHILLGHPITLWCVYIKHDAHWFHWIVYFERSVLGVYSISWAIHRTHERNKHIG